MPKKPDSHDPDWIAFLRLIPPEAGEKAIAYITAMHLVAHWNIGLELPMQDLANSAYHYARCAASAALKLPEFRRIYG